MAKPTTIKIRLNSTAGTGHFYVTKKNARTMTEKMVAKAKGYDRDTIPGDYATLQAPCPKCGGIVKENYRRFTCTGKSGTGDDACGFSIGKIPGGRSFGLAEPLRDAAAAGRPGQALCQRPPAQRHAARHHGGPRRDGAYRAH